MCMIFVLSGVLIESPCRQYLTYPYISLDFIARKYTKIGNQKLDITNILNQMVGRPASFTLKSYWNSPYNWHLATSLPHKCLHVWPLDIVQAPVSPTSHTSRPRARHCSSIHGVIYREVGAASAFCDVICTKTRVTPNRGEVCRCSDTEVSRKNQPPELETVAVAGVMGGRTTRHFVRWGYQTHNLRGLC